MQKYFVFVSLFVLLIGRDGITSKFEYLVDNGAAWGQAKKEHFAKEIFQFGIIDPEGTLRYKVCFSDEINSQERDEGAIRKLLGVTIYGNQNHPVGRFIYYYQLCFPRNKLPLETSTNIVITHISFLKSKVTLSNISQYFKNQYAKAKISAFGTPLLMPPKSVVINGKVYELADNLDFEIHEIKRTFDFTKAEEFSRNKKKKFFIKLEMHDKTKRHERCYSTPSIFTQSKKKSQLLCWVLRSFAEEKFNPHVINKPAQYKSKL